MTQRAGYPMVLAWGGVVAVAVSAFLPWSDNRLAGPESVVSILARAPEISLLLAVGAALLVVAASTIAQHERVATLTAGLGLVAVVVCAFTFPRHPVLWDGADEHGRPTGGMVSTSVELGAVVAVLGSVLVVAAVLIRRRY